MERMLRRTIISSILSALAGLLAMGPAAAQSSPFLTKPYLQLGNVPKPAAKESLVLLWHAADTDQAWGVEYQAGGQGKWVAAETAVLRRVNVKGFEPHRVYQASLSNLKPGTVFGYRVTLNKKPVFEDKGTPRKAAGATSTFAVLGDIAQNSDGQKAVAFEISKAKPDYVFMVGDVVYGRGLVTEYYQKFFPIYNADQAARNVGGPVLRSTLTVANLGNHDSQPQVDFDKTPDGLAYYYYWSQPMNGPLVDKSGNGIPELKGSPEQVADFMRVAPNFPRMGMYSFDYGDVHWTMLDSNPYVDWTDPKLRDWVRNDLRAAKKMPWRFVGLHHPPFNSSKAHFNDQWMRLLSDIFEEEGVQVVFSGHVHNYQRTHPIRFKANPEQAAKRPMIKGKIDGAFTLDKSFDGDKNTKPKGVIWLVTGAGGAGLYNPEQETDPSSWQEFTLKFVSTTHSFTHVTVNPKSVQIKQIAADGRELDKFTITQ
jgi:hypothetical protein